MSIQYNYITTVPMQNHSMNAFYINHHAQNQCPAPSANRTLSMPNGLNQATEPFSYASGFSTNVSPTHGNKNQFIVYNNGISAMAIMPSSAASVAPSNAGHRNFNAFASAPPPPPLQSAAAYILQHGTHMNQPHGSASMQHVQVAPPLPSLPAVQQPSVPTPLIANLNAFAMPNLRAFVGSANTQCQTTADHARMQTKVVGVSPNLQCNASCCNGGSSISNTMLQNAWSSCNTASSSVFSPSQCNHNHTAEMAMDSHSNFIANRNPDQVLLPLPRDIDDADAEDEEQTDLKEEKYDQQEQEQEQQPVQDWKCAICGRGFDAEQALAEHHSVHVQNGLFCKYCGLIYQTQPDLENHLKIHTEHSLWKCQVCLRSFKQKHSLKDHLRTHTGERPFKCDFCPRAFKVKHNLTSHRRLHTGERPFVCQLCPKRFASKSSLNGHTKKKHPEFWREKKLVR